MTPPPDTVTLPDPGPVDGAPETPADTPGETPDEAGSLGLIALLSAMVAVGFLSIPALVIILSFVFMIFMHEMGHYITAKRAGMKVTEFFIGFGPRIWSFRRGETEYGIKAIWAGAYVKIIGMNNLEEVDPADESRTYRQKSFPRRLSVAVAGSAMHFAMALVLLFIVFSMVGLSVNERSENTVIGVMSTPDAVTTQFEGLDLSDEFVAVLEAGDTPATLAGLETGDEVLAIDGQSVESFDDIGPLLSDRGGDSVELTYLRDGEEITEATTVGLVSDANGNSIGFLGVGPNTSTERLTPWDAAGRTATTFTEITTESVSALVSFFSPSGLSNFTDLAVNAGDDQSDAPVTLGDSESSSGENRIISIYGAARIGAQATEQGIAELFFFMVLINIFIGVFNLVPLLPLDGGHVAVATYERIREFGRRGRYHADVYKLIPLTYGVILVLLTVGVLALYADIFDPVV